MFEELNLQDESLLTTSHAQIRSYACSSDLKTKQLKAYLHDLQRISNEQDVGRLLLLLKELIPDYNPGSQLLKTALSTKSNHAGPTKSQVAAVHREFPMTAKVAPAAPMK